jgi:mannose-6-phosphate isomerase
MTAVPPAIKIAAGELRAWLVDKAFPLWWEAGADHALGGFHDALDRSGRPANLPKRARVAARQAFCFSKAPELGWDGPWRPAMNHGLAFLEKAHRRADGLYRARVRPPGEPLEDHAELYDQAFVLLALAAAARQGEATGARAEALLGRLPASPFGGFCELESESVLSNPNMHLFEDFLAWMEVGGAAVWRDMSRAQARLAMDRLVDPGSGAIDEVYGAGWRRPASPHDREVWPGHQFEWAWLLMRFGAAVGDDDPLRLALRLIELAEDAGVDPARNVAVQALDGQLRLRDPTARLWPQTERIKANLLAAEITGDPRWWANAGKAARGLGLYLEASGLWRDRMGPTGDFIDEASPASSFYHIVGAALELRRVAGDPP